MKKLMHILVFLICSLPMSSQDRCVFYATFVATEMYPTQPEPHLDFSTYFCMHENTLETNNTKFEIKSQLIKPFASKDDLLRYIGCYYPFTNNSEAIFGQIIEYTLEEDIPNIGNSLSLISFEDTGDQLNYVFINDRGLYKMTNRAYFIPGSVSVFERDPLDTVTYEFVPEINQEVTYEIKEVVHTSQPETVLLRPAYPSYEISAPEFSNRYHYITQETSTCPEAILDTSSIIIPQSDSYYQVSASEPEFEMVYEQYLSVEGYYTPDFYERSILLDHTLPLRGGYSVIDIKSIDPECRSFTFMDCLSIDADVFESTDTTLYNVYPACIDGYKPAGKFCFSNNQEVENIYATRQYERLVTPSFIDSILIPEEFTFYDQISVLNKADLPDDCVETYQDSAMVTTVVKSSNISIIEHPSEYDTIYYEKYISGGTFEPSLVYEEDVIQIQSITGGGYQPKTKIVEKTGSVTRCHFVGVAKRLIELGYLDESNAYDYEKFYFAAIQYQIDHDLDIGVIDELFIDHIKAIFKF